MLDTNTVSYVVNGKSRTARRKLGALQLKEVACISAITEAELHFGLCKKPKAQKLRASMDSFLRRIQILPWGSDEAVVYGRLRAKQEAAGKTLSGFDLLIAAHAIAAGAILVTSDAAFAHVPELPKVNWAVDVQN